MLNLLDHALELLLQILNLLLLVIVLHTLVGNLLLGHHDLLINGLLVFFPLLLQFFQLSVYRADFALEDAHVLAVQFLQLSQHFLLLLGGFLVGLEVLREVFLLFLELSPMVLQTIRLDLTLADFSFERVEHRHHSLDFSLFLLHQLLQVSTEPLLHFVDD